MGSCLLLLVEMVAKWYMVLHYKNSLLLLQLPVVCMDDTESSAHSLFVKCQRNCEESSANQKRRSCAFKLKVQFLKSVGVSSKVRRFEGRRSPFPVCIFSSFTISWLQLACVFEKAWHLLYKQWVITRRFLMENVCATDFNQQQAATLHQLVGEHTFFPCEWQLPVGCQLVSRLVCLRAQLYIYECIKLVAILWV